LRQQKIKTRTMQMNSLRSLLTEYGEVMAKSHAALDRAIPGDWLGWPSVYGRC